VLAPGRDLDRLEGSPSRALRVEDSLEEGLVIDSANIKLLLIRGLVLECETACVTVRSRKELCSNMQNNIQNNNINYSK
jgi:hypothetical protein